VGPFQVIASVFIGYLAAAVDHDGAVIMAVLDLLQVLRAHAPARVDLLELLEGGCLHREVERVLKGIVHGDRVDVVAGYLLFFA